MDKPTNIRKQNFIRHWINPLMPTVAIWVQLYSILCQTGLSRHLVIFDIRALWRSGMSVRVPG